MATDIEKLKAGSVQTKEERFGQTSIFHFVFNTGSDLPAWWSPARDKYFREFWPTEPFLASAIYSISARNAAYEYDLKGPKDDVEYAQNLLAHANFGEGWQSFITKLTIDLSTQDNGAFIEIIRPAKVRMAGEILPAVKSYNYETKQSVWVAVKEGVTIPVFDREVMDLPTDLPIGIAHLDSGRCQRTGDPQFPVIYTDINGYPHKMAWWQVTTLEDMPSPIESMNGVGVCALSRVFRTAQVLKSISTYKEEKVSGRFNRAIHLTNVDPEAINDAIEQSNARNDNLGLQRYSQPVVAATLNPDAVPSVVTINLASIPDGFDEKSTMEWYISNLALALGVDYGFLAPLPGKGLGTASQSEVQAKQALGKSSRLFMNQMEFKINYGGIIPSTTTFSFNDEDIENQQMRDRSAQIRAQTRAVQIQSGEITPAIARQLATDDGDLDRKYLNLLGEQDLTPGVTSSSTEDLHAEELTRQGESIVTQQTQVNIPTFDAIKAHKQKLLQRPSLVTKIKNEARKAFGKKQIEVPETEDDELENELRNYAEMLEALVVSAASGKIEKDEFKRRMEELVALTLMAIYLIWSNREPEELEDADFAEIEAQFNLNFDSIDRLSDDIYNDRYSEEGTGLGLVSLLLRMALWVSVAKGLSVFAKLRNKENAEVKYRFVYGLTEHCADCLRLNGQVHTTEEWLAHSDMLPQSRALECRGFRCQCSLVETDEPVNGSF